MSTYDTIVIGAGHNGLVCAAYLAQRGQRVLMLEARSAVGGLASTYEFFPGFGAHVAHTVSHFSSHVLKALRIDPAPFAASVHSTLLRSGSAPIQIESDTVRGVGDEDARQYAEFGRTFKRYARALAPFWAQVAPGIGDNTTAEKLRFAHLGLRVRGLGREDMGELLRVMSLPLKDLMDERFDDDGLKSLLAWDGLIGNKQAPRSPNNSVLQLLYRMSEGTLASHGVPTGSMSGLVQLLREVAENNGAKIRTGTPVARIVIADDALQVVGVETDDGDLIECKRVVSSADPKMTFFNMVGVEHLEVEFTNRIRRIRSDGYVAKVHLALSGEPVFTNLERADGRLILAPSLDAIEHAYDHAKYGDLPETPVMEVMVPSYLDPALAPSGHHVLSAHVMYVPRKLKGGWSDAARDRLYQTVISTLTQYAPDLEAQIVGFELLTPEDIEREYLTAGGHWQQGDLSLDQMLMMRPTYGAAQYATPIDGLYLCGAGSHPAGDLTGAPGLNAARVVSA